MSDDPRSTRFDGEIKALEDLLGDDNGVSLTIPMNDLFLIMTSLQFAMVDPRLHATTRESLKHIGRELSKYVILRYPFLRDDIEKGWTING